MPQPDASPESPPRGPSRSHTARRALLILLALVAVLALITAGGAYWAKERLEGSLQTLGDPFAALPTRPPVQTQEDVEQGREPATNILILGSDSRISAGDPNQWSYGAQRTDAIMLLHVPGEGEGAYVISIPRDSWVDIPGRGTAKINAAFSYGGPPLMIQTVEQLTGVHIDHFAVADFESFIRLTDAVGGVRIDDQLLDGQEALAYARQRYGLPGGDFDRIKRQQNWVRALASSAVAVDARRDPTQVLGIVTALSNAVAVDNRLSLKKMFDTAMTMRAVKPKDMVFLTTPVAGTGWSPDGTQSIVRLDRGEADDLFEAVANDRMSEYISQHSEDLDVLGDTVR